MLRSAGCACRVSGTIDVKPKLGCRIRPGCRPSRPGGSQATARQQVKNKLVPVFGSIELKDITTELLQGWVAALQEAGKSGKYIRNLVSIMCAMWKVALDWKYVAHQPFAGLRLPACDTPGRGGLLAGRDHGHLCGGSGAV